MMDNIFTYDLIDDNGVCTIELPLKILPGSFFEHEFGTYKVVDAGEEAPDGYDHIMCERQEVTRG